MALPAPLPTASSSSSLNADLNVTPMLDVLLVLLIMFMATLTKRMVLDVQLPETSNPVHASVVPIVLEVGPRGYYAVNQRVIATDSLHARLNAIYTGRPDKRIIVRGARTATYQEVLHAMDIARGAGVRVIGAETRSLSAPLPAR